MLANMDQNATTLSDNEIVERILGGDTDLMRLLSGDIIAACTA
jgi:hypothetical protein